MAIVTNILDFRSDQPKLFLIYKSPGYFLPRFESVGFSVCEKMSKTVFKMAAVAAILDFQSWSTSHNNTTYQVSSQLAVRFRRSSSKYIFKMAVKAAILDVGLGRF